MPTILRAGPYRFFFYSNESREPAHIHVASGNGGEAKFWLLNCDLAHSYGLKPYELTELLGIVIDNRDKFVEAWNEHFVS